MHQAYIKKMPVTPVSLKQLLQSLTSHTGYEFSSSSRFPLNISMNLFPLSPIYSEKGKSININSKSPNTVNHQLKRYTPPTEKSDKSR